MSKCRHKDRTLLTNLVTSYRPVAQSGPATSADQLSMQPDPDSNSGPVQSGPTTVRDLTYLQPDPGPAPSPVQVEDQIDQQQAVPQDQDPQKDQDLKIKICLDHQTELIRDRARPPPRSRRRHTAAALPQTPEDLDPG